MHSELLQTSLLSHLRGQGSHETLYSLLLSTLLLLLLTFSLSLGKRKRFLFICMTPPLRCLPQRCFFCLCLFCLTLSWPFSRLVLASSVSMASYSIIPSGTCPDIPPRRSLSSPACSFFCWKNRFLCSVVGSFSEAISLVKPSSMFYCVILPSAFLILYFISPKTTPALKGLIMPLRVT